MLKQQGHRVGLSLPAFPLLIRCSYCAPLLILSKPYCRALFVRNPLMLVLYVFFPTLCFHLNFLLLELERTLSAACPPETGRSQAGQERVGRQALGNRYGRHGLRRHAWHQRSYLGTVSLGPRRSLSRLNAEN